MERLYREYGNEIEFLIVYIREAHPEMLKAGNRTGVEGRPKDIDERLILATECVTRYRFTIPMVIDAMDGTVNGDYQAAPVRVTVTDRAGKVAYYAGRGPFDFRLSRVESVLKKLVAHDGFMPPAPPAAWGEAADGLLLGLSLDPPEPVPGETVAVLLSFRNVGREPLFLYYRTADALAGLEVTGSEGRSLRFEPAGGGDRWAARLGRGGGRLQIPPQKIEAGALIRTDVEAKIVSDGDPARSAHGAFEARYSLAVTEETIARARRYRDRPYWTGTIASGAFGFTVTPLKVQTCLGCHGNPDWHHEAENECSRCHTGEEGTESWKSRTDACASCHPREGIRGRRLIPETSGSYSVHIAGKAADAACLRCHDHDRHRQGNVQLIDPCSFRKRPWTGSETEFCLRCHDGELPPGLSFPDPAKRYVKSAFLDSPAFLDGKGCTDCHTSHGSKVPHLLKREGIASPHD